VDGGVDPSELRAARPSRPRTRDGSARSPARAFRHNRSLPCPQARTRKHTMRLLLLLAAGVVALLLLFRRERSLKVRIPTSIWHASTSWSRRAHGSE